MIMKPNLFHPSFERLTSRCQSPGGPSARPSDSGTSFASIVHDLLGTTEKNSEIQNGSTSLDSKTVQELIWKITERMNSRLLTLVGEEEPVGGSDSLSCWKTCGNSAPEEASRNRRIPPENDRSAGMDELEGIITEASKAYGVDRDLIRSVVKVESGFRIRCTSSKGASGLMQLMPGTARELGVTDSFDPVQNIMGGTRYLRKLLDRYHGDVKLALASYNWGMGNVESSPDRLPLETVNYISRVMKHYDGAKA